MIGRLTELWHGTGRMVVADSYFASFLMCIWCMSWGLYFTGIVKTATKFFPIKWEKTVEMAARSDTKTAMTVKDDVTVIAHVWNDPGKPGKPRKILVSTIGTTLDADPVERPRKKKDEETGLWTNVSKFIKGSALIKHYFDWAGAIDRHNCKRMDGLWFEIPKSLMNSRPGGRGSCCPSSLSSLSMPSVLSTWSTH